MGEPEAVVPAEPPVAAAPVSETQRLRLIDALRGVALLGHPADEHPRLRDAQLLLGVVPERPDERQLLGEPHVIAVLFEGKMRALFGMIFGAGVLLFVMKKEQTGKSVTGLFYRRMFWLVLFGLIHAHLILWIGDILYLYGICGMLVYLFRNVNPKYLVLGVPLVARLRLRRRHAVLPAHPGPAHRLCRGAAPPRPRARR